MSLAIKCKGCGREIPADDVNIDTRLAKCRSCNAVFQIMSEGTVRKPVPMPRNIVVAEGPESLDIVRKWKRTSLTLFMALFAGLWNAIVFGLLFAVITIGFAREEGKSGAGAFVWLFLTPFVLVGAATAYAALALLLNRTRITRQGEILSVTHEPFRWFGRHTLDASQISQLYCTEYASHSSNGVPQYRMCVNALMKDGARIELVKGLEDKGQAFYLEDLIERHLRIAHRPISGEYKGGLLD
jgi:hypothetical protein